jgi:hypothetical protein
MRTNDDDFRWSSLDDRAGPARPIGPDEARNIVRAAMAPPLSRPLPLPLRRGRGRRVMLVAAALALVGASALALTESLRGKPGAPRLRPVAPIASAAAPVDSPRPSPPPSLPSVPAEQAPRGPQAPSTPAAGAAAGVPPVLRASERAETIEGSLAAANALRAARQWAAAASEYERVVQIAPESAAAQAARIAAADLRLEQLGDPRRAEQGFLDAQRRGGPLAEEALWGVARARRARGDVTGERAALQAFLQDFAGGAMAPRARERLAELSPDR